MTALKKSTTTLRIIGHRGAKGLAPENTLASFNKAIEHGADEIELDVRLTKDHQLIVVHDRFIHDNAGNKLDITKHSLAELQHHRANLVTLSAAIAYVNRRLPVQIEIKPGVNPEPAIAIVKSFTDQGWLASDFLFGSFDQTTLRSVYRALPGVERVVIERWSGVRAHWRARQVETKRLSMRSTWLWGGFLKGMQRRGYRLTPYTINNPSLARRWQPYIYGIVTDRPDLFEPK